ncbi:MAG TPA: 4a-hydroxytetrahydrobiopterin dehydratase [Solirubrobacteraceae bacterium]|nr:4a-hydroxytetrahydrobiopterin dehydratase [Solirubrobacteraceae bacterium]
MAVLTDAEIEQRLARVPQWQRGADAAPGGDDAPSGDDTIVRELALADFAAAIALVDRVAAVAEAANHHPDILVHGWNKVRLTLSTHSQGGLTDADFALAAEIDRLV